MYSLKKAAIIKIFYITLVHKVCFSDESTDNFHLTQLPSVLWSIAGSY